MVKVWDMDKECLVCCKETGFTTPVITIQSQGEYMHYCGLYDGHITSMDTRCKEVLKIYDYAMTGRNRLVSMNFMDEYTLLLGDFSGSTLTVDLRMANGSQEGMPRGVSSPLKVVDNYMSDLQCHPNLSMRVATSLNSELCVMDGNGVHRQSIRTLEGFRAASLGCLQGVAMHPLDAVVATYNKDGMVYVFN